MDSREELFYGLGIVAFAVAKADGAIHATEKKELHELLERWCEQIEVEFDVTEIIFSILANQKPAYAAGYDEGMRHIRLGSAHLTSKLKEMFIYLIKDIAHAFPPVTAPEKDIIASFTHDIQTI